jgi:hypothetical protein
MKQAMAEGGGTHLERWQSLRRLRRLAPLVCVAMVIANMPSANAASKFDGMWSAVFRTKSTKAKASEPVANIDRAPAGHGA